MTEKESENSILIDISDDAYKERMELSLQRLSEFDEDKRSALFLCCKKIYENGLTVNEDPFSKENGIRNTDQYEKITSPLEKLFLHEFSYVPKLKKYGRMKDITVLLETLIQLEIAIEEDWPEEEITDILYSYIYDYTEEYTELFAKTGHGILHISDEITPFGIENNLCEMIGPLFGDRLKAKKQSAMEEAVKKHGNRAFLKEAYIAENDTGKNGVIFVENSEKLTEHQNNILKKFMKEMKLLLMVLSAVCILSACGKKEDTKETEETISVESMEAEDAEQENTEEEDSQVVAETLSVIEESDTQSKYYGIMYAKVLDIDTVSGSGSRYTLEDKNDPENAWSVTAADVSFINVEMKIGSDIVVLYHGDIINDFENVSIIAMLANGRYKLGRLEGMTLSNQMEQFSVSVKGQEVVFFKDNCRIDSEAMNSDHGDSIIVYYADGGNKGKWPLRVLSGKKTGSKNE